MRPDDIPPPPDDRLPASLYRRIFDDAPDYVSISRLADGVYLDVNPGFTTITGWGRDEAVGRSSLALGVWATEAERQRFADHVVEAGAAGFHGFLCELVRRDGRRCPVEIAGSCLESNGERLLLVIARDISARKRDEAALAEHRQHLERLVDERTSALREAHDELRQAHARALSSEREAHHRASHDGLTGLPNRALLQDRLEQALAVSGRAGTGVSVLFIDLDGFKQSNDSLGHRAGDEVLRETARRLRGTVRHADTVARLGGDEFVVVLAGTSDGEAAAVAARKLLEALGRPMAIEGRTLHLGASIGIASSPDDATTAEGLLQAADAAMYQAKRAGKNTYRFHRPMAQREAMRRATLEQDLHAALASPSSSPDGAGLEPFVLHYQPILDLAAGRPVSHEALVRWRHPRLGLLPPEQFLPAAERTGLIVALGDRVLDSACATLARWRAAGERELGLAVNVSVRQLASPGFAERLRATLARHGLPPGALTLEIAEACLVQDSGGSVAVLQVLAGEGVRLSIDDFGGGGTHLAALAAFPLSQLKIHASFIDRIDRDARAAAVAGCIVALGAQLGLEVVALGVERPAQAEAVARLGVTRAQGFHHGSPVPEGPLAGPEEDDSSSATTSSAGG